MCFHFIWNHPINIFNISLINVILSIRDHTVVDFYNVSFLYVSNLIHITGASIQIKQTLILFVFIAMDINFNNKTIVVTGAGQGKFHFE